VPSMAEIAALPWNGYNAISTFSGCGGSSLGYKMAGFRVLWANEFVPAAQDTYRANHPATQLDTRDIRQVSGKDILDAIKLKPGELDLFDGSPPCASFSTAGRRDEGWGKVKAYSDTKQRTDDLFYEYARLVREVQPRIFVAENVSGLVKGTAKGYFKLILEELKRCGYKVEARLLDAQWLGVPQMRQRLIFIGVRNDLPAAPIFPSPLPYRYSVKDALIGVDDYIDPETNISRFAIGSEWEYISIGTSSTRYLNLKRSALNGPSFSVTAQAGNPSTAGVTHPTEKRKFSISELKRIGGFPDDFILTGSYEQQWERIGRAVPPVMMMHIATAVKKILDLCKTSA
jgi:DNA (cytosine-5)-methyltransferase 1